MFLAVSREPGLPLSCPRSVRISNTAQTAAASEVMVRCAGRSWSASCRPSGPTFATLLGT